MLYPSYDTIPYRDFEIETHYKTIVAGFDSLGEEQRKRKWLFPKRKIYLSYFYKTKADARIIRDFFNSTYGPFSSFSWFSPQIDSYTGEYVGTGDGTNTVWNLPGKTLSAYTVYVDTTTMIESTDYTISEGTGADGATSITFVVAPEAGSYITIDFTGYLKVVCRFAADELKENKLKLDRTSLNVELQGSLNE